MWVLWCNCFKDNLRMKGGWEERIGGGGMVLKGEIMRLCCVSSGLFVMTHYSFSSGTHGKVFTKPSAKIAQLNWADVQLLRKWMFFKGASQCCTPVSVKGPSRRRLLLSLSLCACASEAHHHTTGAPCSCACCWLHVCWLVFCVFWNIMCLRFYRWAMPVC